MLEAAAVNLDRVKGGLHGKGVLFVGLRGVGKTVLLNRVAEDAETRGLVCLRIEAPENRSLPVMLAPALRRALLGLDRGEAARGHLRRAWRGLASFVRLVKVEYQDVKISIDADPEPGLADTGDLEADLTELFRIVGEAARERGQAVALFIDELQYVETQELAALITALHACQQRRLPVTLVGAGLPQLVGKSGRAKSYAERLFHFQEIGKLEPDAARRAIQAPAERADARFDEAALERVLRQTEGYPYFLQEWGSHAWLAAEASPITAVDVVRATELALETLDAGFFRVRYDRCTPKERAYLRAMAGLGPGPHRSGDIAGVLGRGVTQTAPLRNRLISKGMIYSPAHGDTAFTVPMFDAFLQRAAPGEPD